MGSGVGQEGGEPELPEPQLQVEETPAGTPRSVELSAPQPPDSPRDPWSWPEIEAELSFLVQRYPELCRLDVLGRSVGGRDIPLLVVTLLGQRSAEDKPALFFFDAGPPGLGGAETTLEFARRLLALGSEESMAAILRQTAVYIAPTLDPDLRAPREAAVRSDFQLNFPVGWLPEALRPGSGDFPLSRPETMATVRFLESHPNLVVMLGLVDSLPPRPRSPGKVPSFPRGIARCSGRCRGKSPCAWWVGESSERGEGDPSITPTRPRGCTRSPWFAVWEAGPRTKRAGGPRGPRRPLDSCVSYRASPSRTRSSSAWDRTCGRST